MGRGKKKKEGKQVHPGFALPEAGTTRVATSRDPGTGLLYGKDANGNVYKLTHEEFASGAYHPATDEDVARVHEYEQRAERMGPGETAGLAFARGLTGRLIDVPLAEASPEYAKNVAVAEQEHPYLAPAAEMAGMAAPLLIPGAGEEATAARMLTVPGALEAAGRGAGALAEGAVGPGVISGAARFGLEGAGYGATNELSRQALEGKGYDWDKVWNATQGGLLFAGALGAGFGGVGRFTGARTAAQEAAAKLSVKGSPEELAANARAELGTELHPKLADYMGTVAGQPGRATPEFLAKLRSDPDTARMLLENERVATQEALAQEGAKHIGAGVSINDYILDSLGGPVKREMWEANLAKDFDPTNAHAALRKKLSGMAEDLDTKFGLTGGSPAAILDQASRNEAAKLYEALNNRITALDGEMGLYRAGRRSGQSVGADLASTGDMLKRFEQQYARGRTLPKEWQEYLKFARAESDPRIAGSLASTLERGDLWGERAAGMQREINAAVHRHLSATEALANRFTVKSIEPSAIDPYRNAYYVDPKKVHSWLDGVSERLSSREVSELRQYSKGAAEVGELLKKYSPRVDAAALDEHIGAARGMDGWLDKVSDRMSLINQARMLERTNPHTWARIAGFATGGALGAIGGGPFGAILGGIAGSSLGGMLDPYGRIRAAIAVRNSGLMRGMIDGEERWANRFMNRLAGVRWGAKKASEMEGVVAEPLIGRPPSQARAGAAARALLYNAFREKGDDDVAGYEKALEQISFAGDPRNTALLREGIVTALGDIAQTHPQAVDHYVQKVQRAAETLQAFAPVRSTPTELMFGQWSRVRPSHEEIAAYEDVWEAVLNPKAALDKENLHEIRGDVIDVLDYVHPDFMADVRSRLAARLADRSSSPEPERLVALSVLFKQPFAATMQPEYFDAMQDNWDAMRQMQQQMPGRSTPRKRPEQNTGNPTGVHLNAKADDLEAGLGTE